MKYIIRYYHTSGGENLESLVALEALESFIRVLLTTGYRIVEVV